VYFSLFSIGLKALQGIFFESVLTFI